MSDADPILLILDVDETLIYATEEPLERAAQFRVGPYHVYSRPGLPDFLSACAEIFQLAVWSSSSEDYLSQIIDRIFPTGITPAFVWSRARCVRRFDGELFEPYFVKDLKKVKRLSYDLDRVLIVEDTPQKVERNYGNAIYVRPFEGDPSDCELPRLADYLRSISTSCNLRRLEKRGWRQRAV